MRLPGITCLLFFFLASPAPSTGADDSLTGKDLVESLRRGNHVIYFRHAATDWSQDDKVSAEGDWTSCDPERMRQLSPAGREVAQRIGQSIRQLGIPIGRVFSSEYCRTRETARAMGLGPVTPTRAVMNMRAAAFVGGRDAVVQRARRALATQPRPGTNDIYVAHGNLMRAASGAYTAEAGAAIFLPRGEGEFELVATLAPEAWEELARKFADP